MYIINGMALFHIHKIQLNKFSTFGVFAETFFKNFWIFYFTARR
ncbi:unnamed protein product [Callosobruchus maculatus]|uniref:Uncharacterized protein n=1 Tax=Callosobruchus maculatus TaxID=64391 RepID=A0A653C587_CALMS|nr:unnamed protein product [Callosobruchus maculatus]